MVEWRESDKSLYSDRKAHLYLIVTSFYVVSHELLRPETAARTDNVPKREPIDLFRKETKTLHCVHPSPDDFLGPRCHAYGHVEWGTGRPGGRERRRAGACLFRSSLGYSSALSIDSLAPSLQVKFIPTATSTTTMEAEAMLRDMCASGSDDVPEGADCVRIMGGETPTESSYSKHRFLSGTTTEVSFVGPNLGPLAAVIVGPQSGTWGCSEVVVSSSADNGAVSSKFLSKERNRIMGDDPMYSAQYLVRVPLGSVMYGEGPDAKILSASDAMQMATRNMTWYEEMKKRLLVYTATVGVVGTGLAYGSLGPAAATAFASGGAMSFAYQVGLQRKVDRIGSSNDGIEDNRGTSLVTGALPFLGVSVLAWFVYSHPELLEVRGNDNLSVLLALLAGFGSQKLALVLFSMGPWGGGDDGAIGEVSGAAKDGVGRGEA